MSVEVSCLDLVYVSSGVDGGVLSNVGGAVGGLCAVRWEVCLQSLNLVGCRWRHGVGLSVRISPRSLSVIFSLFLVGNGAVGV